MAGTRRQFKKITSQLLQKTMRSPKESKPSIKKPQKATTPRKKVAAISGFKTDPEQIKNKLLNYLLDLDHKDGGPKAKFFKSIGYTKDNWDQLAKQLVFNPQKAKKRPANGFGQPYSLQLEIKSADGSKNYKIETGWFQPNGETIINLSTAYPGNP